jgi:hypothetical protein
MAGDLCPQVATASCNSPSLSFSCPSFHSFM